MDELIDILDADGNITGKTALKSEAHRNGWFHQTVHIWFYTSDGQILLQQRAETKNTYPLLWDVSVAGHVGAGESIELSAMREVEEEIGLTISKDQLQKIDVFKSIQKHNNDLIDCEFHHTHLCELTVSLENLQMQKSEVEALKTMAISQILLEITDKEHQKSYVPHDLNYYQTVLKSIKDIIGSS